MAFTNRPTAQLVFGLIDASGSKATMRLHVPYATLAAVAIAAADVLRPLIAAMTDCTVVSQSLTYSTVDTAPGAPVAGSRVEEKGVFGFRLANGLPTRIEVPAIKDSMLLQSGAINTADLAVFAFIEAITAVDAVFSGADGSDITALTSAYQKFRNSSRNMLPSDRFKV